MVFTLHQTLVLQRLQWIVLSVQRMNLSLSMNQCYQNLRKCYLTFEQVSGAEPSIKTCFFLNTHFLCYFVLSCFFFPFFFFAHFKAQAEERAAMLRAQLEERKKVILQRINKEGKDKLEKVLNLLIASFFISLLENVAIINHLNIIIFVMIR